MERVPECVLLRILTALPLRCALGLRLVCKAWNALLTSPRFLQTLALQPHSLPHHLHPCFVMAPPLPPTSQSRFSLFLYIPGIWLRTHFILPCTTPALIPMPSAAAHQNFVAIFAPPVIRVFHLRTSSHHDITSPNVTSPPFPQTTTMSTPSFPWSNLFIFSDDKDESYHLFLCQQSLPYLTLFIYSSKFETWRSVFAPFLCSSTWYPGESNQGESKIDADKEAEFFWNLTVGADEADLVFWNSTESMLVTYCIESDEWKKIRAFSPRFDADDEDGWMHRGYFSGGAVFKCQGGRVVLVCAVVMDEHLAESSQLMWRQIKGFRVWDLETTPYGNHWRQVASAPDTFWEAYYCVENAEPEFKPKFIHDGTCICMTSAKHSSSQRKLSAFSHNKLGRYKPPLLYDLSLNSWSYLPRHSEDADDLVGLFTFKTSLSNLALQSSTSIIYG